MSLLTPPVRRVLLAVSLLLLTVPWWPLLGGQINGFPAWALFALGMSMVYAGIVAWLLGRHWDDGSSEAIKQDTRVSDS